LSSGTEKPPSVSFAYPPKNSQPKAYPYKPSSSVSMASPLYKPTNKPFPSMFPKSPAPTAPSKSPSDSQKPRAFSVIQSSSSTSYKPPTPPATQKQDKSKFSISDILKKNPNITVTHKPMNLCSKSSKPDDKNRRPANNEPDIVTIDD